MMPVLDQDLAGRLATIVLGHVTREYPNKLDHVLDGPGDARTPRDLHPVFYGSYDWHSCVHAYWVLARLLRRFPGMTPADAVRDLFRAQLTAAKVAAERAYLGRPSARGFERPYGWAWLLMLAAELSRHAREPWSLTLAPLATAMAARFKEFLPKAAYPVRSGTHSNTAFALALADAYAAGHDHELGQLIRTKARAWYEGDIDCPAWEPGGDDFLSPALMEAVCMGRLLPPASFAGWFEGFLPDLARGRPACLFEPARVSDRSDGKIAHLDGLNLSRAWCWRLLAAHLPEQDPRRGLMKEAAARHLAASLPHVAGDYMGEHWLPSFAVLALEPVTLEDGPGAGAGDRHA